MEAWLILILVKVIIEVLSVKDKSGGQPTAQAILCPSLTENPSMNCKATRLKTAKMIK